MLSSHARKQNRTGGLVMGDNLETISQAVVDGDDKQVVKLVKDALTSGISAMDILDKGLVPGIRALGELFKDGEVYLPEILISTRAMNRGVGELQPHLAGVDIHRKGTVVLGTVEGDLHDIGKNLVGLMLGSNGFNVIDVGADVSADSFVSAAQEHNADIVAMSALLTTTITYFLTVIEALEKAGLRSRVKVMIGGAPVTRQYADEISAEGFAEDCALAVDEANRLMMLKQGGL
jgi:5-methyltetrahydrofolate--homocysteine methyltransferase